MNQPFLNDNDFFKSFNLENNGLLKAIQHKYIKRTGSPGKYKYWYRDQKTGKMYNSLADMRAKKNAVEPKQKTGKKKLVLEKKKSKIRFDEKRQTYKIRNTKNDKFRSGPAQIEYETFIKDYKTAGKREQKKMEPEKTKIENAYIKEFLNKYKSPEEFHNSQRGMEYTDSMGRKKNVGNAEHEIRNHQYMYENMVSKAKERGLIKNIKKTEPKKKTVIEKPKGNLESIDLKKLPLDLKGYREWSKKVHYDEKNSMFLATNGKTLMAFKATPEEKTKMKGGSGINAEGKILGPGENNMPPYDKVIPEYENKKKVNINWKELDKQIKEGFNQIKEQQQKSMPGTTLKTDDDEVMVVFEIKKGKLTPKLYDLLNKNVPNNGYKLPQIKDIVKGMKYRFPNGGTYDFGDDEFKLKPLKISNKESVVLVMPARYNG